MAGVTLSTTLSGQYRAFFSKELLRYAVQKTVLDQFATKAPIPKGGHKGITMFRFGAPSIADVQALTEGTVPALTASHQLALSSITKNLAQYGHSVTVTDIMKQTELFNSVEQATKVTAQNMALWFDAVQRNTLVGSDLATSNGSIGAAAEGAGTLDNSDVLTEVYGQPATVTQTFTGLNSETTNGACTAAALLDIMTLLKNNRAPEADGGGYVYVTDNRVARDLMRDTDWLDAAKYSAVTKLYKGEVGSLYGVRVVVQTNSFVATGSGTNGDRRIYNPEAGGLGTGKAIYASFAFGSEAWGVPHISGNSPFSPSVNILDKADKSDQFNQKIVVATKAYFTALRLNPAYYAIHWTKTGYTL